MSKQDKISIRETISPAAEKWIKVSAILAMIIVAISSAILSFDGLQKVALASQVPQHLAFLFPIAVDTTILMGSLAVLLYELFGVKARFGWFTVLFGTLLSITGNVISVKDAGLIAQVLHGIIPVLLCLSLESLLRILRFNIKRTRTLREGDVTTPIAAPLDKLVETPVAKLQEPTVSIKSSEESTKNTVSLATQITSSAIATETTTVSSPSEQGDTVSDRYKLPAFRETPELNPIAVIEIPADAVIPVMAELPLITVEPSKPLRETRVAELPKERESAIEQAPGIVEPTLPSVATERLVPSVPLTPIRTPAATSTQREPAPVLGNQQAEKPAQPAKKKSPASIAFNPDLVERCKIIVESLPEDMSKARKVAEIFRVYPDATTADIREALGELPKTRMDGTISRARAILKEKNE